MTDWWKETHGEPPETVFAGLEWRPVPGIRGLWESPYVAPLDWQMRRFAGPAVEVEWLDDKHGFDDEREALEFIREELRRLRTNLAGLEMKTFQLDAQAATESAQAATSEDCHAAIQELRNAFAEHSLGDAKE